MFTKESLSLQVALPQVYTFRGEGDSGRVRFLTPYTESSWCLVSSSLTWLTNLSIQCHHPFRWVTARELFARFPYDGRTNCPSAPPEVLYHPEWFEGSTKYQLVTAPTDEMLQDPEHLFVQVGWMRRVFGAVRVGITRLGLEDKKIIGFREGSKNPIEFTF